MFTGIVEELGTVTVEVVREGEEIEPRLAELRAAIASLRSEIDTYPG